MRLLLFVLVLLSAVSSRADGHRPFSTPAWMLHSFRDIRPPESLSGAEQDACVRVVLDALNRNLKTHFTHEDVLPIQMEGWQQPETGFVRGGGFNIRIGARYSRQDSRRLHIHSGRFADWKTIALLGGNASLHIPKKIHRLRFFNESLSPDGQTVTYDFVAHIDTGYAYLPVGFFVHIFRDIVGSAGRNPCPVEKFQRDNAD